MKALIMNPPGKKEMDLMKKRARSNFLLQNTPPDNFFEVARDVKQAQGIPGLSGWNEAQKVTSGLYKTLGMKDKNYKADKAVGKRKKWHIIDKKAVQELQQAAIDASRELGGKKVSAKKPSASAAGKSKGKDKGKGKGNLIRMPRGKGEKTTDQRKMVAAPTPTITASPVKPAGKKARLSLQDWKKTALKAAKGNTSLKKEIKAVKTNADRDKLVKKNKMLPNPCTLRDYVVANPPARSARAAQTNWSEMTTLGAAWVLPGVAMHLDMVPWAKKYAKMTKLASKWLATKVEEKEIGQGTGKTTVAAYEVADFVGKTAVAATVGTGVWGISWLLEKYTGIGIDSSAIGKGAMLGVGIASAIQAGRAIMNISGLSGNKTTLGMITEAKVRAGSLVVIDAAEQQAAQIAKEKQKVADTAQIIDTQLQAWKSGQTLTEDQVKRLAQIEMFGDPVESLLPSGIWAQYDIDKQKLVDSRADVAYDIFGKIWDGEELTATEKAVLKEVVDGTVYVDPETKKVLDDFYKSTNPPPTQKGLGAYSRRRQMVEGQFRAKQYTPGISGYVTANSRGQLGSYVTAGSRGQLGSYVTAGSRGQLGNDASASDKSMLSGYVTANSRGQLGSYMTASGRGIQKAEGPKMSSIRRRIMSTENPSPGAGSRGMSDLASTMSYRMPI